MHITPHKILVGKYATVFHLEDLKVIGKIQPLMICSYLSSLKNDGFFIFSILFSKHSININLLLVYFSML